MEPRELRMKIPVRILSESDATWFCETANGSRCIQRNGLQKPHSKRLGSMDHLREPHVDDVACKSQFQTRYLVNKMNNVRPLDRSATTEIETKTRAVATEKRLKLTSATTVPKATAFSQGRANNSAKGYRPTS